MMAFRLPVDGNFSASSVIHMVEDAYQAARVLGDSLLLLDRYFLIVPALETLKCLNRSGAVQMKIITKAKRFCTAFEKPGPHKPGRGRPSKKRVAVHLKELFVSHKGQFQEKRSNFMENRRPYATIASTYPGAKNCTRN